MHQRWVHLTFLHWPVQAGALRPLVHPRLQIEEYGGTAWVAVSIFRIEAMRLGPVPHPPFSMPELNVRTYVTDGNRSGVWFLSLDATSRVAVAGGHLLYRVPYVHATMKVERENQQVRYRSARADGTTFEATSSQTSEPRLAKDDPFEGWYAERYCLYSGSFQGPLYRADIAHDPWRLSDATVSITRNDMLSVHGIAPAGAPAPGKLAEPVDVKIWPLQRLRT